ncbi:dipeptidase [Maribacter polysaccharolyticus]|uniref:dipeptidase n=1 Tax=Maribacter polysaccharolyticus TaxID=3020831 RepID=UPI00237F53C8|nr:membrane dipeptidase [Maribacter polysaccharolyticus]MDE3741654.1 membrane dipeptidase [Maribacter polysaccharolyticus]
MGVLFPGQVAQSLSSILESISPEEHSFDLSVENGIKTNIEKLYKNAIVNDGLIISRNWNDDSFKALAQSGYTGFNASVDSGSLEKGMKNLTQWQTIIKENPDRLILATSANDYIKAKKEGKVAVLLGFQNSTMVGNSIKNLDTLYDAGMRWMQLTYNQRNLLGDGSTERTNCGLSDFGLEVVERMNELGIIIDLSHCGEQTTNEGIEFSKTPVSINHSMCEALHRNHPRAKTDEQIKAMADKGGIIGIICLGYMIGPNLGTDTTLETYVDHIDHAVKIGGIDHVGVASDFAIQGLEATGATRENWYVPRLTRFKPSYKVQWPPWIPELDKPDRYLQVAKVLDKRGYSTGDIEKILGQNWLRFYNETLK